MGQTRAKFKCTEVSLTEHGNTVTFNPVVSGSKENESFFKWTPYGEIKMGIVNPDIHFEPGHEYYVDFTLAK